VLSGVDTTTGLEGVLVFFAHEVIPAACDLVALGKLDGTLGKFAAHL